TGAAPDVPPGVTGDEVLEVTGEVRRGRDGAVDVVVAQDLPAGRHSTLVGGVAHRSFLISSCRASARSTSAPAEPRYVAGSPSGPSASATARRAASCAPARPSSAMRSV